jgi:hypothetical protein
MYFFGVTRFSVYLPNSKMWNLSQLSEQEYLIKLFSDERLALRFDIFINKALPIYQEMSKKYNYRHIVHYSNLLPEKWKKILIEAASKNPVLYLDEVYYKIESTTIMANLLNTKESGVAVYFIIDDDDLLSIDYLDQLSAYARHEFIGMAVSFGFGIVCIYSNGCLTEFKEVRQSLLSQGQAYIGNYNAYNKKLTFPQQVDCSKIDMCTPTILDSRSLAFVWTHHESQDVYQKDLSTSKEKIQKQYLKYKQIDKIDNIYKSFPTLKSDIVYETTNFESVILAKDIFYKNLSGMKIIDSRQKDKGLSGLSSVFGDIVAKNISNEFFRLRNSNIVKEFVDCINTYGHIRLNPFGNNDFLYCNKSFYRGGCNFLYFHGNKIPFFMMQTHVIVDAYYFPTIGLYYGIVSDFRINSLKRFIESLTSSNAALDYLFSPARSTFLGWIAYHNLPYHYFYDVMPMVHVALTDKEACKYPIVSIRNEAYLKLDDFYDCKLKSLQGESLLLYSEDGFFIRLLKNNFSKIQNEHNNVDDHIISSITNGRLKYKYNYNIIKPVIWIGIIAGKRTWVEQVNGYALIIRKILKIHKNAFFIFDGMTTFEGVPKKNYQEHQTIMEKILSKVSQSINYINLNGAYASEKLYFASMVDFFITDGATASMYVAKFFKKYGVAFLSNHTGLTCHSHCNTIFYPQNFMHQIGSDERWYMANFSMDPKKFAKFVLDKLTSVLEGQTHDL